MRLLIVTQKVDRKDPILGFFHRWIEEFAKKCEQVTVIGQFVGDHQFQKHVQVLSLGKERGLPRWRQVFRFWRIIWSQRRSYDAVLVHMTPMWVVLGAPLWWIAGKPMYQWYEARGGGWVLRIAEKCVQKIFSASAFGMPWKSAKQVVTGHGIDTEMFSPGLDSRDPQLICSVGRITASKNVDRLVDAFTKLGRSYQFVIAGEAIRPDDQNLLKQLHDTFIHTSDVKLNLAIGTRSQEEVVSLLQRASLFLHASATALDKALLEAMACECPVISAAEAACGVLPSECVATLDTLVDRARHMLDLDESERIRIGRKLRMTVVENHSLPRLIDRLVREMQ
ncbi:MAG: hypothetical protein Greene041619_43 [Candidatus Peregrinibacteria bacterium Greene0416_19]|nr:MAG: hypothetical protein Greene041619_43 [Candidatus Peregrinibacteria bacterium Greene0416_19]